MTCNFYWKEILKEVWIFPIKFETHEILLSADQEPPKSLTALKTDLSCFNLFIIERQGLLAQLF